MKKTIIFILIILLILTGMLYLTYGREILSFLDEKKVYTMENVEITKIDTLEDFQFYNGGIVTYNNQKIEFFDYNNNKTWENENTVFSKQVFITDNYIFRCMENSIEVYDKNNQRFVISEITGDIVNVSRENGESYIIARNSTGQSLLYVMDDNNEIVVDNKIFKDIITGVSISDKSEGYSLITLNFENGIPINSLYFNLLDDVELWNTEIKNEILIKTQIVNNNVIVIGLDNIYYFNTNGRLMWKNNIYNKILDFEIDKDNQRIYMLYEQNNNNELMSYNFEGKVMDVQNSPADVNSLKIYNDKAFVYNDNIIYLLHSSKMDKIYEDTEGIISDFIVDNSSMYILSKDKLVKGQIK
ncbi:MAG: DUF5711 family protein [Sedimentibacter sp.]|uniref:DUF5711 family protein n=1 Tax=Sedimentibacter sp. TaxID=1960295 RepID=UPI002980CC2F|nr:DUF5711 family protein [Sedimentibacter sp.]MDW5300439.1 DUF5711 family protein [Sedimentibacter sp.]